MTELKRCCDKCNTGKLGFSLPQCFNRDCPCHTTPTVEPTDLNDVAIAMVDEVATAVKKVISPTEGWLQELHNAPFYQRATPSTQACMEVFYERALAEQKARMVEDLKKICNKSKTERGLAIALGNFIKALSK